MLLAGTRAATPAVLVLSKASKERTIVDMAAKQMRSFHMCAILRAVLCYATYVLVHMAVRDSTFTSLDMSCHDVSRHVIEYILYHK